MKKKDDWVTQDQVTEECEQLLAEGKPIHAINANMVIDRLGTKGRRTVYKYVDLWRGSKLGSAVLPPFVLDEVNRKKLTAVFTGMLGEIVRDDRQAAAELVAAATFSSARCSSTTTCPGTRSGWSSGSAVVTATASSSTSPS